MARKYILQNISTETNLSLILNDLQTCTVFAETELGDIKLNRLLNFARRAKHLSLSNLEHLIV
ncbi:hypothetical protein BpHYR1_036875 [Brachionus plicatilis]|uniref:Uncharacterized protein n=1 Tax=Brachionus plicatilis TaxID=10195 RepID=A0A3M7R1C9_BRAPC|nr:hypothetical protein BpHYR1_036875 [Brachionus plicatilis]